MGTVKPKARALSVLMKNRHREPVMEHDQEDARAALAQLAEAEGLMLSGDTVILDHGYSHAEGLHVVLYGCEAVRAPGAQAISGLDQNPGTGFTRAAALALHAHRNPLHSKKVIAGAVERALRSRDPVAALIALHLLRIPAENNADAAYVHHELKSIFTPGKP